MVGKWKFWDKFDEIVGSGWLNSVLNDLFDVSMSCATIVMDL